MGGGADTSIMWLAVLFLAKILGKENEFRGFEERKQPNPKNQLLENPSYGAFSFIFRAL